ncbi:MFS transporter [Actinoplanes sp. NPDC051861]|uniref:MFS transporter n=1 Tax=Actinoplanes sp. NPDC051861 TaxID=3155170 RepID=UPI003422FE5E
MASDTSRRSSLVLATLFAGTFVMGSAELIVVGVLDLIAVDFSVPVSRAGLLVTAYAAGIALAGPLLTALTIRMARRPLLLVSLALYVAATGAAAMSGSFGLLLALRGLTGALQGLFIGVAFGVAARQVAPERAGKAIAVVIGGVAVSSAVGVPLGTLLANAAGWQASFIGIALLGVIALAGAVLVVPPVPNAGQGGSADQARHALAPRVLALLALGLVVLGGQFAALTYIAPFLSEVTGMSGGVISLFLLAFGAANAVGTFAGGAAADRAPGIALVACCITLTAAFGVLLVFGRSAVAVAVAMTLWGIVGFGLVPSLQHRVVLLAGPGRDLASSLPASAVTTGIAVGAVVGGWALDHSGSTGPVVTALAASAASVLLAWATNLLKPPPSHSPVGSPVQPAAIEAQ